MWAVREAPEGLGMAWEDLGRGCPFKSLDLGFPLEPLDYYYYYYYYYDYYYLLIA